ncbi:MAG: type II toxin-antitoxin system RatA family toxin [Xanthobacteraceae bacterium]
MATRSKRLHLRWTPAQMFDLVADVERYPEFLPWVIAARIRRRQDQTLWVDMTIGTSLLRKRVSTVAVLERPQRIHIFSHDPIFECFEQNWNFEPAAEGGTTLAYQVDFSFRSPVLQTLIGAALADRFTAIADAFQHRAWQLYRHSSANAS